MLMLAAAIVSSCAGHAKPPTTKEYCNRVNAIDDEYQAKYKEVWKGRVNPDNIASQLAEQVALERDQLSRLKKIPFPQLHNELARRYLRVLSEFVLSEEEYVRRYRVDKSATRNATAVRLRAETRRLSLELAKSCA
jgi:hypothetical protein